MRKKAESAAGTVPAGDKRCETTDQLQRDLKRYGAIVDNAFDAIVTIDRDRRITFCNPAFTERFGYTAEEAVGRSIRIIHPSDNHFHQFADIAYPAIAQRGFWKGEWQYQTRSGAVVHMEASLSALYTADGSIDGYTAIMRDITHHKQVERALREGEKRLKAIIDSILAGIIVIDIETRTIIDANPMALKTIGADKASVIGQTCHRYICPADRDQCPITDLGQQMDRTEGELITHTGERVPILKTVTETKLEGKSYLVESFLDISEIKKLETKLRHLASTDALTGLFNRRKYNELTQRELNRAQRYGEPLSIAMFDIDHFKRVNDTYGHPAGDTALCRISHVCQEQLRENDILGRIGGEEFAITFIRITPADAVQAAERIRKRIESTVIDHQGTRIRCTVSFGLTHSTGGTGDLDLLIQRADEALYAAKSGGRNRVCVYESPAP